MAKYAKRTRGLIYLVHILECKIESHFEQPIPRSKNDLGNLVDPLSQRPPTIPTALGRRIPQILRPSQALRDCLRFMREIGG